MCNYYVITSSELKKVLYILTKSRKWLLFVLLGVADASSEVADGSSETTYVAMQPQEGHVEETITSMDTSDDVG
jgi:hypothetical protein